MNIHSQGDVQRRRSAILRIVAQQTVPSQEELQGLLGRAGFRVAQPTLSRDLRELGLAKTPQGYVAPAAVAPAAATADNLPSIVRDYVLSVEAAGSLVVCKTLPAEAGALARALDQSAPPECAGTIAGDDTIFLACRKPSQAKALARRLERIIAPSRAARR